jgi:hypothetical protein
MRKPKIVGLSDLGADAHEPMLSVRQRLSEVGRGMIARSKLGSGARSVLTEPRGQ